MAHIFAHPRLLKYLKAGATLSILFWIVSYLSQWSWIAEITVSFSLQHFLANALLVITLLTFRLWKWGMALTLVCAIQVVTLLSWAQTDTTPPSPPQGETLRIFQYNVQYKNQETDRLVDWLRKNHQDLDIVFLVEMRGMSCHKMEALSQVYPHRINDPEKKWFTQTILSKLPIEKHAVNFFDESSHYYSHTRVKTQKGKKIDLYGLHAITPLFPSYTTKRNKHFQEIARDIHNNVSKEKIFVGDFNMTPYSSHFSTLLKASGLKAPPYPLFENTWPSWLPVPGRITLDHCLVSDRLSILKRTIGPDLGSDHLPVITEILVLEEEATESLPVNSGML